VEGEFKFVGSNDVCDLVGFLELKVYVASGSANMTPIGMLKGSKKDLSQKCPHTEKLLINYSKKFSICQPLIHSKFSSYW
jgi:hypothetical protein